MSACNESNENVVEMSQVYLAIGRINALLESSSISLMYISDMRELAAATILGLVSSPRVYLSQPSNNRATPSSRRKSLALLWAPSLGVSSSAKQRSKMDLNPLSRMYSWMSSMSIWRREVLSSARSRSSSMFEIMLRGVSLMYVAGTSLPVLLEKRC